MANSPSETVDTGPFPHSAMDYAALRAEGQRLLGELAGGQWTDFNSHDPGITILEQVCYAITDLAYRINFSMPDLLAGGGYDAHASLPSASTVLSCAPVTTLDLRKLAMDAGGGSNAWIEAGKPECAFFFHESSGEIHLGPDPSAVEDGAVVMRGLHRVWLPAGQLSSEQARASSLARLHANRPLAEDISVEILRSQPIWIEASIEVEGGRAGHQILGDIIANIEAYFAPRVGFEDMSQGAKRCEAHGEELFDGPVLERGFLCDAMLASRGRRREVYASDIIRVIADVPDVRAVRRVTLAKSANGKGERWALEVTEDAIPTLAPSSSITLLRDGLPLPLDSDANHKALAAARAEKLEPVLPLAERDRTVVEGRDRDLGRYHSVLEHFPLTYGVGPFGLPPSASPARHGQAKQLQAYVLLFDQLLANSFSQLAHARELFSHFGEAPQTYFGQVVTDEVIKLDRLRDGTPEAHRAWLERAVVDTAVDDLGSLERRARFLGHLLARYAEQLDEVDMDLGMAAEERTLADIRRKLAFLRHFPRLSSRRGSGCDVFEPRSVSGLVDRLRLELGLDEHGDGSEAFVVVEHALLRPIDEDRNQQGREGEESVPLLVDVERGDPYSLQLTVVLNGGAQGKSKRGQQIYSQRVEALIIEHAPAHIEVSALWLTDVGKVKDWSNFSQDYRAFRDTLADYRRLRALGTGADEARALDVQLRLRDARDRVIEHLGLGGTYPLRDIPLPELLIIPADTSTQIQLGYTQAGVRYVLCDGRTGEPVKSGKQGFEIVGDGGPMGLTTPVVLEDLSYKIQAVKPAGLFTKTGARAAWLHTEVTLKEGVDPTLDAAIVAPLLDTTIDNPKSTDARVVFWGATVQVEIYESQEGVLYSLVDHADHDRVLSEAEVVGTAETIALSSVAFDEDVDLRVLARKPLEAGEEEARTGLLDIVLPLRVRANPNVAVQVGAGLVNYGASATLKVAKSQHSARYRVHHRPTFELDYYLGDPAKADTVPVSVGGKRKVQVSRPPYAEHWTAVPRMVDMGQLNHGNGKTLSFTHAIDHGQTYIVRALKTHQLGPLDAPSKGLRDTQVQLKQAQAVLVRPNPKPSLVLRVVRSEAPTVELFGGEGGVFYELVKTGGKATVSQKAFFHQRDEENASLNHGVGQLRVGGDLVIARDVPGVSGELAKLAAATPVLDVSGALDGTRWKVVASRAITEVSVDLEGRARIVAVPELDTPPIEAGQTAVVTVVASVAGDRYQLFDSQGKALTEAADGDGKDLALKAEGLSASTDLFVSTRPVADDPIVVEQWIPVRLEVTPAGA